jgi:RNA polymerase sigma-70 factor (ECF subfamily)
MADEPMPDGASCATGATRSLDTLSARPEAMAALMEAIAKRKDRTAFASLFGYYAPRLKSYLRRQRVEDRQAEDLVQEIMLTVWRKASLFDPAKASAGTWIFTIARNRLIDAARRLKRPELDAEDPSLAPEAAKPADEMLMIVQTGRRVHAAVATLPPDQAEVVALSFMEGLAHSEIAERLHIPLGTVKSRLRLAFGRLRVGLEDMK